MSPIYTRTGDFGETSLMQGKRVLKCDDLVNLYGSIDELNSYLGLVVSMTSIVEMRDFLEEIQKDLLTVGSYIAGAKVDFTRITRRIKELEARIDSMEKDLSPIHRFILPGGVKLAAYIHVARSIARRVERKAVFVWNMGSYKDTGKDNQRDTIIPYLNRLSDFLFVLARFINKQEHAVETIWEASGEKKTVPTE